MIKYIIPLIILFFASCSNNGTGSVAGCLDGTISKNKLEGEWKLQNGSDITRYKFVKAVFSKEDLESNLYDISLVYPDSSTLQGTCIFTSDDTLNISTNVSSWQIYILKLCDKEFAFKHNYIDENFGQSYSYSR